MSEASITFYGGAGSVTGANFLFDIGDKRILIDCGAVERERTGDDLNLKPFAYDPASIDVLVVTHAHADHIGRIPKLVHDGFKGIIYSTPATHDLAEIMFEDSINVMRNDMERHGSPMMYEIDDVKRTMPVWRTHPYHEKFAIGTGEFEFLDAGHILGSSMVRCTRGDRAIIFTGDLGNSPEPLLNDTESASGANYILMESVYGDRVHENREERTDLLHAAIEEARRKKGVLLIPSFSIERTQVLLFEIEQLISSGKMQPIPVYLDAPLAIRVTDVFRKYTELLNPHAQEEITAGNNPFSFKSLKEIENKQESEAIHKAPNPKVIIAGAGMSSGGRIRAHEKRYLPDPDASVLFVGYQAPGSLGRRIYDGEKKIFIDGDKVAVKAKIDMLTGYSGHKDRDGLLEFVGSAGESLEQVFVAMGEPAAEMFLVQRIRDFLGVSASAPEEKQSVTINW